MKTETMLTAETATPAPPGQWPHRTGADWRPWVEGVLSGQVTPEDYLPVPREVLNLVELDRAYFRERLKGEEPAEEYMAKQLEIYLLAFYYGGTVIGYLKDDRGIIVVAVDLDQISDVCHTMPQELKNKVAFAAPEPLWCS